MLSQAVVIATEAEDEVAGLSDVDAVSDVLEEEGEAFPSGQRRHVALGQSQVSAGQKENQRFVFKSSKSRIKENISPIKS